MCTRPAVLSASGVAAAIAVAAVLMLLGQGTPEVQAAVIIQKLNQQIDEASRFVVKVDHLTVDNVAIDGEVQLHSDQIAGEVQVRVQEGECDGALTLDVALAITGEGGWVLIRDLTLPDPKAQAALDFFLTPGVETLLLLPQEEALDALGDNPAGEVVDFLRSKEAIALITSLISSHAEYGATVEHQPDGTVLLTIPVKDVRTLAALHRLTESAESRSAGTAVITTDQDVDITEGDERTSPSAEDPEDVCAGDLVLIGSTFVIVYDPKAERVLSFGIHDLGPTEGHVIISIEDGCIDPALLDADQVAKPNARVLDLAALEAMARSLEEAFD
jgi:hypothetical protein